MKCQTCGYSLWNLPEPRCPECGESFNVEDWTFESGTVRFHCNACDHPLMHRQPDQGPARCSNCNEVIAWSDVRVVPVGDPSDCIAHRQGTWSGLPPVKPAVILLVAFFGVGVLLTPGLLHGAVRPSLTVFAMLFGFLATAGIAGVAFAPRRERRVAIWMWSTVIAVFTAALTGLFIAMSVEHDRYAWYRHHFHPLRDIAIASSTYMYEQSVAPSHPLVLIPDYLDPSAFLLYGWGIDAAQVPIGRGSLNDWILGTGVDNEKQAQIMSDLEKKPAWIRLGDLHISVEPNAWEAYLGGLDQGEVVVAIGQPHRRSGAQMALFSHGGVWQLANGAERNKENARRIERGLAPLPSFDE